MVTIRVTAGSERANHGSLSTIGVSQPIAPAPTWWATTVAATGLDSDASWKTVSASTLSPVLVSRTPKPLAYSVFPPCTTATAIPGMPEVVIRSSARPSNRATALSTAFAGNGMAGRSCGGWPDRAVVGAPCGVGAPQAVSITAAAAATAPHARIRTATRFPGRRARREQPVHRAAAPRHRRRHRPRRSAAGRPARPTGAARAGTSPSGWAPGHRCHR